jgi:hypothetical protein
MVGLFVRKGVKWRGRVSSRGVKPEPRSAADALGQLIQRNLCRVLKMVDQIQPLRPQSGMFATVCADACESENPPRDEPK